MQVVRQFQRLDVTVENPQTYMKRYGNSVLDTNELLAQARQLGITENIVCHSCYFIPLSIINFVLYLI